MFGVAMILRADTAKPEIHEFDGKVPSTAFHRKALGGEGEVIPHFRTVNRDGTIYSCIAFHQPGEGERNAMATTLLRKSFEWQGRKIKPLTLAGPVLVLYGDDEFMKKVRA